MIKATDVKGKKDTNLVHEDIFQSEYLSEINSECSQYFLYLCIPVK